MDGGYSAAFRRRKTVAAAIALAGLLWAGPAVARESLGAWDGWAAFRDEAPRRCYAIARPSGVSRGEGGRAQLTIGRFPPAANAEVSATLSRPARGPIRLRIGDRGIVLSARGDRARTAHARADASVIAAMRGGEALSLEALDRSGRPFRDVYALAGAASAIDAALLGCTPAR